MQGIELAPGMLEFLERQVELGHAKDIKVYKVIVMREYVVGSSFFPSVLNSVK